MANMYSVDVHVMKARDRGSNPAQGSSAFFFEISFLP